MADFPTRAQLFEVFANELLTRAESQPVGSRITPEEVWTPGSDINLIGAGASAMGEEIVRAAARATSDLTLDGAQGQALDRLVADRYSPYLARKTAAPAYVTETFTRPTAAAGVITIALGSILQTSTGVRFKALAAVAFGVGDVGPHSCTLEAVEAGTTGNVATNTINRFQVPPADPTIVATNGEPAAGGVFTESDEALRSRARLFYGQARRGVLGAIEFGALTVPGVEKATAEEVLSEPLGIPNGFLRLYIADANGQSNAVLNAAVLAALLEYRGGGCIVDVYGATPIYQSIQLHLAFLAGTDTLAALNLVKQTIVARVQQLAPSATLELSLISEALRSVDGVIVGDDAVTLPVGDVVPTPGQMIRTRLDLITNV